MSAWFALEVSFSSVSRELASRALSSMQEVPKWRLGALCAFVGSDPQGCPDQFHRDPSTTYPSIRRRGHHMQLSTDACAAFPKGGGAGPCCGGVQGGGDPPPLPECIPYPANRKIVGQ